MKVLEELRLRNGAVLAGRIVQSPMVTRGSTEEGFVTDENLKKNQEYQRFLSLFCRVM